MSEDLSDLEVMTVMAMIMLLPLGVAIYSGWWLQAIGVVCLMALFIVPEYIKEKKNWK